MTVGTCGTTPCKDKGIPYSEYCGMCKRDLDINNSASDIGRNYSRNSLNIQCGGDKMPDYYTEQTGMDILLYLLIILFIMLLFVALKFGK